MLHGVFLVQVLTFGGACYVGWLKLLLLCCVVPQDKINVLQKRLERFPNLAEGMVLAIC